MESGDIIYDEQTTKKSVVLGEDDKRYKCLNYDMNVVYVLKENAHKIGTSYALFKVMYDITRGGE